MQQLSLLGSVHGVLSEVEGHLMCTKASNSSISSLNSGNSSLKKHLVLQKSVPRKCKMQVINTAAEVTQTETKEKPKEAKLWGGRFEKGVTPAVEKFGQSVSYDWKLYKHDLMGSRAHASMLAKQVYPTVILYMLDTQRFFRNRYITCINVVVFRVLIRAQLLHSAGHYD